MEFCASAGTAIATGVRRLAALSRPAAANPPQSGTVLVTNSVQPRLSREICGRIYKFPVISGTFSRFRRKLG
jgi:hypothetical protein